MPQVVQSQSVEKFSPHGYSFSFHGQTFQQVVHELERVSGLHFIYSTDKIAMDHRVTLSVHNRSIEEVLVLLGKLVNLSFKVQGKYVVIKTLTPVLAMPSQPFVEKVLKPANNSIMPSAPEPESTTDEAFLHRWTGDNSTDYSTATLDRDQLETDLQNLQVYFNAATLRNVPARYINKITRRNKLGWFASGGFVLNDYSVGAEFQAGMRPFYAVLGAAWMSDSKYKGSYGVGSSLHIKRNFSVNPVISFSPMTETTRTTSNFYGRFVEENVRITAAHWQMKWMVQYTIGRNLNLRAGPTFNRLTTTFDYQDVTIGHYEKSGVVALPSRGVSGSYDRQPETVVTKVIIINPRRLDYQALQHWVGWEASISYRINFSGRR
ncbi:DUF4974 domain-containing protein [Chryseolinea lacunae]|nr:DUF4974 domain-containing protein [Chryseolinea lacunae]